MNEVNSFILLGAQLLQIYIMIAALFIGIAFMIGGRAKAKPWAKYFFVEPFLWVLRKMWLLFKLPFRLIFRRR